MPLNLIEDFWLPVRRLSGARGVIRPGGLTAGFHDDPVVGLDFPRADWNAAVCEWLIGLTFLALRPDDEFDWAEKSVDPPAEDELLKAFSPFAFAFHLTGEGPLAFQDLDALAGAELKSVAALLIDAPGENTVKNNADLFVKRGGADSLCLPFAAAALITLQTYAPSGGAGHRTSMRGGGPLTTLIAPRRYFDDERVVATLWDKIWANTPDADFDRDAPDGGTPRSSGAWSLTFPWLAPTRVSRGDGVTTPESATPAQAFFGMPRRIRLVLAEGPGRCALGGGEGEVVVGVRTVNYGVNYVGWTHPLSPYRRDLKTGDLPVHPQAGAADYGDFVSWWGFKGAPARGLVDWSRRRALVSGLDAEIEAFGYDMDNMKARQWLEARLPWLPATGEEAEALKSVVSELVGAADEAARAVRYAVKLSIYGLRQPDGGYRLPDNLPRDALPEPAEAVWRSTSAAFNACVRELIASGSVLNAQTALDVKQAWLATLRRASDEVFATFLDIAGLCDANPHRVLKSRETLRRAFNGGAVARALGLKANFPKRKEVAGS